MLLYFIRHGERDLSRDAFNERIGRKDYPLTDLGHRQARALPEYFKDKPVSRIYASRYVRTKETAAPLCGMLGLAAVEDPRLDEIDQGHTDGLTAREIEERFPAFSMEYKAKKSDYRIPGGESGAEVKARQDSLLAELIGQNLDSALFSHEGFIRLLLCNVFGLPVYQRHRFQIDFCSVTELEYLEDYGCFRLRRANFIPYRS